MVKYTIEQTIKAQRGGEVYLYPFFNLCAKIGVGGQRHALVTVGPGKRPSTHYTGGCVGPRAGLEGSRKSRPYRYSIPGPSSP